MSVSITAGTRKNGNRPCNKRGCKTCQHIKITDTFRSSVTKKSYKVHTSVTCKTKGVVYLIECRKCPKQYVGSTKNALHIRLNGHKYDIKHKKTQKPVAKHFNRRGHSMEHLTIMVIEKLRNNNIQFRRRRERFWIDKLECMAPEGMNLIWCAYTSQNLHDLFSSMFQYLWRPKWVWSVVHKMIDLKFYSTLHL